MGLEKVIVYEGMSPSWAQLAEAFQHRGLKAVIRMIDGQLAFPDESPPSAWHEVRLGFSAGMITLRAAPGRLFITIWGNASPELVQVWDQVAQTCAEAVAGTIESQSSR